MLSRGRIFQQVLGKFQSVRSMASKSNPTVAVVLSGSGVYDGSEVHEASAVLVNLSRANATYKIYAPDINQMHVVNHTTGQEMDESRNVLVESARIARGNIQSIDHLSVDDHDALIFPGGFGAAKNLSNFAVKNEHCELNEHVGKVLKDFHNAKKPIGLCCIAPVLAAKAFPGCQVTLGKDKEEDGKYPYSGATQAAVAMGATHINKDVSEIHVDEANRLVTTPAYMCETKVHEIHDGVGKMVNQVLAMI